MVDIIQEEGGTIDKFEGDAIIAFLERAPCPCRTSAVRGVRAALRCQAKLGENAAFHPRADRQEHVHARRDEHRPRRCGEHGLQDPVRLHDARRPGEPFGRLEGINKQFRHVFHDFRLDVGENRRCVPGPELSRVAVVGRKEPVTVYEPMLPEEYAERKPTLETFDRGLKEYYAGRFAEAERIFEGIAPSDPPAASYAKKCDSSPPALSNPGGAAFG